MRSKVSLDLFSQRWPLELTWMRTKTMHKCLTHAQQTRSIMLHCIQDKFQYLRLCSSDMYISKTDWILQRWDYILSFVQVTWCHA